jgi:hypothetical protein
LLQEVRALNGASVIDVGSGIDFYEEVSRFEVGPRALVTFWLRLIVPMAETSPRGKTVRKSGESEFISPPPF